MPKINAFLLLISVPLSSIVFDTYAQGGITSTSQLTGADTINTITTAVPFLRIQPDARSGAMGDVGLAISPDANSMYFNPAKLVYCQNNIGVSVNYTPWLRQLVKDIYLLDASVFYKVAENQAIGLQLRYFSLGNITFTDINGGYQGQAKPNEFAVNIAYSRSLGNNFSTGLGLKFVRSDLASGQVVNSGTIKAGVAAAADISVYYRKPIEIGNNDAVLAIGSAITNIGSKISYTDNNDTRDFIPTNFGVGSAFSLMPGDHHKMTVAIDINKLLVPTPTTDADGNGVIDSREKPAVSGILGSFGDAPGGGKEELRELMYSLGAEYWYDNQFAVRAGYYTEHITKGNRKFFTIGLGVKYNIFNLNFSYLIPTNGQNSPLENTMRFSLLFNFNNNNDTYTETNNI